VQAAGLAISSNSSRDWLANRTYCRLPRCIAGSLLRIGELGLEHGMSDSARRIHERCHS
jgi:hypothetical protein